MKEELNRKQTLLNTLSRSLKTELDQPKRSLIRIAYLEEKIELLELSSVPKLPGNKTDFRI